MSLIRDGREALNFIYRRGVFRRAPRPDLVLLDLRLPELDGLEVLDVLKNDPDLSHIPVVIMTASRDEQDRLKCRLLDVEAYITKPVDLEKFLSLVKELKRYWHEDVILPSV